MSTSTQKTSTRIEWNDCRLTGLQVGNFKAFADVQEIPIRPLTLLFGANSSGKSSIIHSLLLANHALANGNLDVQKPRLAGESVDLGGFREYVHQHDSSNDCKIGFTFQHNIFKTAPWFGEFSQTRLRLGFGPVAINSLAVELNGEELLRAGHGERQYPEYGGMCERGFYIERINFEHPYFTPFFAHINTLRPPESEFRRPIDLHRVTDSAFQLSECIQDPEAEQKAAESGKLRRLLDLAEALETVDHEEIDKLARKLEDEDREIRSDFSRCLHGKLTESLRKMQLKRSRSRLLPVSWMTSIFGKRQYTDSDIAKIWTNLPKCDNHAFFDEVTDVIEREIGELLHQFSEALNRILEHLSYLGPLRFYPPRHLVGMHDEDPNWFSGGGHAWNTLRDSSDVRWRVNRWLASLEGQTSGYEIKVRQLKDLDRISVEKKEYLAERLSLARPRRRNQRGATKEARALESVREILSDISRDKSTTVLEEVSLVDRRTGLDLSHRDVGVGISQVLPVLVHAYADKNQTIAIEQPEIHLHPALQAELGDAFIESALGEQKNTFILETHSEHLILRIMRRMRETYQNKLPEGIPPVTPKDVAILFVEKDGSRSIVREMPLNEMGQLVKSWPGGFFEEGFRELFP